MENPDKWVVVKFKSQEQTTYKVFASYYGGYMGSDSWRLNSGISKIEEHPEFYDFHGFSGSIYRCAKGTYGTSGYSSGVLNSFLKSAEEQNKYTMEVLPEETDFCSIL